MRRRIVQVLVLVVIVLLLVAAISNAIRPSAPRPALWSFLHDYRWWWWLVVAALAGLLLVWWLLRIFLVHPAGSPWREHVLASASALEHELDGLLIRRRIEAPSSRRRKKAIAKAVRDHLERARYAAYPDGQQPSKRRMGQANQASQANKPRQANHGRQNGQEDQIRRKGQAGWLGREFVDWWTGASVESAYVNLHEAEIALAQLLPEDEIQARIPEALARLQTMDVTDPRRRAAEKQLASTAPKSQLKAAFQSAVRIGLELKDQQHDRLRGFRNITLSATVGLMVLVVAVCLVGAFKPDALPLCFGPPPTTTAGGVPEPVQGPRGVACPSEEAPPTPGTTPRRLPAPGDITLVVLLGMLGGGLSGAIGIRNLQGSSTPYDVPVVLSLLKLPSGALSALVGLLFVRGGFVPGLSQLDSQPQILAYAFLFGIAQQIVTRLVDQQAQDILAKVPSKEPTSAKPEPSPEQPS
jgi:hypothetical protein